MHIDELKALLILIYQGCLLLELQLELQVPLEQLLVLLVLPALLILCDGIVCRTTRGMTHLIGKQEVVK